MMAARDARTMHVGRARARARTHAHARTRTRTHAHARTRHTTHDTKREEGVRRRHLFVVHSSHGREALLAGNIPQL